MNEKEAMEYIAYLNTLGSKPGLTVIRELLRRAGDPQKELLFIHIAGTNGKGSVSAFSVQYPYGGGLQGRPL